MTVDQVQNQPVQTGEKPPASVQNDLNKEVEQNAQTPNPTSQGRQQQTLATIAATQPLRQIQATAQNQIEKGKLDIRI